MHETMEREEKKGRQINIALKRSSPYKNPRIYTRAQRHLCVERRVAIGERQELPFGWPPHFQLSATTFI